MSVTGSGSDSSAATSSTASASTAVTTPITTSMPPICCAIVAATLHRHSVTSLSGTMAPMTAVTMGCAETSSSTSATVV
jgi:hypothetical protein